MQAENIRNVSVIGAGLMGHGIAQLFASKNYNVYLLDVKDGLLSKAVENIRLNLSMMATKGQSKLLETAIAMLATTSIGAIWSSCATETNHRQLSPEGNAVVHGPLLSPLLQE